jgi:cytochrome d ubiquinol oxidase subunit I
MDVVMLSRLQFAITVFFHFIFVPLTLGLSVLLAIMETKYVRTGDEQYKRMVKFWGKLFLLNFTLGVVTGITLEFQFGTNWSQYSEYVGDIFGSLLAIEATLAFFLESTFIAVWHFGWDKVSKKVHLFAIWAVAVAGNLSALWIILANGWMQHPVGYEIVGNRAVIAGFWDGFVQVLSNGFAWSQYLHVILGSWLLGGFFVMGVSAWHLLRNNEKDFFSRSFKLGSSFALVMVLALLVQGHHHGTMVAKDQPAKLAAMEGLWETSSSAPMYVLAWPDEANRRNSLEAIPIPGLLSFLAYGDFSATVKGLNELGPLDFAEFQARTGYDPEKAVVTMADGTSLVRPLTPDSAIPPVLLSFLSFRLMLLLAGIFLILAVLAFINRDKIGERPLLARLLLWSIPLPYICLMAGWTLAEVGRQPWLVYKLMTTTQGISAVPASSVGLSLAVFITVYSLLGAINIYLLRKYAIKGPAI